jgi:hypothetical protein
VESPSRAVERRAAAGKIAPEVPDHGLIRCWRAPAEVCEAHPGTALVAPCLRAQGFGHRGLAPERSELHGLREGVAPVAACGGAGEAPLKAQEIASMHDDAAIRAAEAVTHGAAAGAQAWARRRGRADAER